MIHAFAPRAFIFDVDRTLSTTHGVITPETKRSLQNLARAGFLLGVCTGRSFAELRRAILPLFPSESWHIVSGGAQVVSSQGDVLWEQTIPDIQVRAIGEHVRELGAEFGFSQGNVYAGTPPIVAYKAGQAWPVDTMNVDDLSDWTTCLLTIGTLNSEVEEYIESLAGLEVKAMVNSIGMPYYDITPQGITKREGATIWAQHQAVLLQDIAAFGDSENDLEVLDLVGVGVAMGNAIPELKAIADMEIGHADENGVAVFLDDFLQQHDSAQGDKN